MTNEELVSRIQQGEQVEELTEQLIVNTLPFALWIARKYAPLAERNRGFDMEDLRQSAVVGLLTAIPYWKEERGTKFLTVAGWFCHREILSMVGSRNRLENSRDIPPMSTPIPGKDGRETELIDTLADETAIDPAALAEEGECARMLAEALQELPEEMAEAVRQRWLGEKTAPMDAESRKQLQKGMRLLMKSERLCRQWEEYTNAPYNHAGGVRAYQSGKPYFSSVESAVIRREALTKAMGRQASTPRSNSKTAPTGAGKYIQDIERI